jgi:hypothetical protein
MEQKLKLIYVHVPKTGGNSLRAAIGQHFSPDRVHRDYADRPDDPSSPMNLDPIGFLERSRSEAAAQIADKDAVIGHFWIKKYDSVPAKLRATMLREPISRAISHYFYWLSRGPHGQLLHDYVREKRLGFIEFVRLPVITAFYTKTFFREVDMAAFDFIGNYDDLSTNWGGVLTALGLNSALPMRQLNPTSRLDADYEEHCNKILNDNRVMAQLRDVLAADIDFYERHALR